ncbi:MAG: hypothetical protein ICV83_12890 [Cytophagales bacterium]|nr:hypothetical protein [Cytophagales bacterium]
MKPFISKYGGILAGACYGFLMRIIFNSTSRPKAIYEFADLFSVTFIWIVPVLIGITPMLFATREQLKSTRYLFTRPVFTVFLFFVIAYITRIEDIICLLIVAAPFMTGALLGGLLFSELILKYRKRNGMMYSVLLIPLLAGFVEEQLGTRPDTYRVRTAVVVDAPPDRVWENIVRVKRIGEHEYTKGFFNHIGNPAPRYAELDRDTLVATRTGYYEVGLVFREKVTGWNKYRRVAFSIHIVPGSIRHTVFDQHVLKGSHFRFVSAAYELQPLNSRQTLLVLSSAYELDTRINGYAAFWGDILLSDFQERLLAVIKNRCSI